jgi:hypothetical protein
VNAVKGGPQRFESHQVAYGTMEKNPEVDRI